MTTQKTFKRRIRERMAKTGESYTAAREQLLPKPGPEPTPVQAATGRPLEEWFALLDAAGAGDLPHREIARLLRDDHGVPPWWSQNVTVEYERARGRRVVGQDHAGVFYAGVTKTIRRPAAEVHAAIEAAFGAWGLARRPSRARLTVRADAEQGRVAFFLEDKGDRCTVAVRHEHLADADAVAEWKAVWRERLAALASACTGTATR